MSDNQSDNWECRMTPITEPPIASGAKAETAGADIVARLRSRNGRADGFGIGPVCDEAADTIEALRAQVAALERSRCVCVDLERALLSVKD